MMDAMHARRDKNEIQPALPGHWQPYVAVLKECVELKDELIDDKGQRWPPINATCTARNAAEQPISTK